MTSDDGGDGRFVSLLGEQRAEAEQFLEEQRIQFEQLESELLTAVEQLAQQLDGEHDATLDAQRQWRTKAMELERQGQDLLRWKEQLTARQEHWRQLQALADERQRLVLEQIAAAQAEHQARAAALDDREAILERQQAELQDSLSDAGGDQREQLAQVERERDELREQVAASDVELNDLTDKLAELAEQVHQLSLTNAELQEQGDADQLEELRARLNALEEENRSLREAATAGTPSAELEEELDRLSREKIGLIERLTASDERIAELERAAEQDGAHDEKFAELKQRFTMAIDDVRSLKRRNAELEEKLTKAGVAKPDEGDAFDWESQKKRLIASLESDFDPDDEEQQAERLTAEGTIRITDEIVSRKDREIAELKQLLDDQSSNVGSLAVGANAIQATLDSDELIRQERENLTRLKEEMREKLRKAEVDISLERAKLARERAELEERLSSLEHERSKQVERAGDPEEPARGRWLARMGLKNDEPEKK